MLPVRGLWPGFGQGSALGLMCFPGPVVSAYLPNDYYVLRAWSYFP